MDCDIKRAGGLGRTETPCVKYDDKTRANYSPAINDGQKIK